MRWTYYQEDVRERLGAYGGDSRAWSTEWFALSDVHVKRMARVLVLAHEAWCARCCNGEAPQEECEADEDALILTLDAMPPEVAQAFDRLVELSGGHHGRA